LAATGYDIQTGPPGGSKGEEKGKERDLLDAERATQRSSERNTYSVQVQPRLKVLRDYLRALWVRALATLYVSALGSAPRPSHEGQSFDQLWKIDRRSCISGLPQPRQRALSASDADLEQLIKLIIAFK
jgi:hypothetical protein